VTIKNGHTKDTGIIWLHKTQDEDKQNKRHRKENYKDEQHGPHTKPGVNSGACEG
jgi:hypothetical protein